MFTLIEATFLGLHEKVEAVFDLIGRDLDMAVADAGVSGNEDEGGDDEEFRLELVGEIEVLKGRHGRVLQDVGAVI